MQTEDENEKVRNIISKLYRKPPPETLMNIQEDHLHQFANKTVRASPKKVTHTNRRFTSLSYVTPNKQLQQMPAHTTYKKV